jgi:extracellular elastinolytic metalloproteinase
LIKRNQVSPVAALVGASNTLQLGVDASSAAAVPKEEIEQFTITGSNGALSDPSAHLVYIQSGDTLALTWRVETDIDSNWLLSFVDAKSPEKVYQVVDYVAEASYNV